MRPISMTTTLTATAPADAPVRAGAQVPVRAVADTPVDHLRVVAAPAYEPVGEPSRATDGPLVTAPLGTPPVRRPEPVAVPAGTVEARRVAARTVTALLEVLDRRRPAAHLETAVSPQLYEHIVTLLRPDIARPENRAAGVSARIRRIHIQMCDPSTAEIFGSFERGRRVRAFAGRIERVPVRVRQAGRVRSSLPVRVEYRWRLATLEMS